MAKIGKSKTDKTDGGKPNAVATGGSDLPKLQKGQAKGRGKGPGRGHKKRKNQNEAEKKDDSGEKPDEKKAKKDDKSDIIQALLKMDGANQDDDENGEEEDIDE